MENELVRYSRAGDIFHYRWAARRCLRMIYPKSSLQFIKIEGSENRELAGEYVIDVAEYWNSENDTSHLVNYYQLKHTTVQKETSFQLSDLQDTIEGFAKRFSDHRNFDSTSNITFSIVTNRPISENFKNNILKVSRGETVNRRFLITLNNYTSLSGSALKQFCATLNFVDGEGDYNDQNHELHIEISQLLAGTVDNPIIDSITALIQSKVLPDSDGKIIPEEIFKRLGVTSERDMYPAPPEYEKLTETIEREQHQSILNTVLNASSPLIIHAAGGVGKSVFALQIAQNLPLGSIGVVYDCFGGGRYRNRSESRHRHRDGLVQIANELASKGLCDPLIAQSTSLEDEITRSFISRITMAVQKVRQVNSNAILAILIDAADNAEMAAKEYGQPCFVHEILRERLPDGCRLIALCRTERINLLEPSSSILQVELNPFTEKETLNHMRKWFSQATEEDGKEFYRLTHGNPRVQANALSLGFNSVEETLENMGPIGTTVNKQIEAQLDFAISTLKEKYPLDYQVRIDAICLGLANLPPFIPLDVLSTAADVDVAAVKSFIADLGRPLWLSDRSVQFRDEPTETWFREKYSARPDQIIDFIDRLKPLAHLYSYVAETLPSLLLQAGKHNELIELALSDDLLPSDNPIDERNVRIYRLQFAFKAAIKLKRYSDAIKLALRAGEETAGDKRQLELLSNNLDLIAPLQDEQRVQELAFRRVLRSNWAGSENVYAAALLSSIDKFKGEARGYLRAANNWLRIYFEEQKNKKNNGYDNELKDEDIVELTFALFNQSGPSETVNFLLSWSPKSVAYRIGRKFIRRLIDAGNFNAINDISLISSRSQYLTLSITQELLEIGKFPVKEAMETTLNFLINSRTRIPKPRNSYYDTLPTALISFAEACAANNMSKRKILRILRHYFPSKATRSIMNNYQDKDRDCFLRMVALKSILTDQLNPELDEFLPQEYLEEENKYRVENDIREFKEVVGGLLPWYILRARLLVNDTDRIQKEIEQANQSSINIIKNRFKDYDVLRYEKSRVLIQILILSQSTDGILVDEFYAKYLLENNHIWISDRLKAVHSAYRLDHLSGLRNKLEKSAYEVVANSLNEGPETRGEWFIDLARAVLPVSPDDAAAYFNYAIEAVSKFGDEIVQRWEALARIAHRSAENTHISSEMTYRFIRCAELIGDNVEREKYFNRNEAVRISARLSPVSALAALSRWRDRDVGWFESQLPALVNALLHSRSITPTVGWSLSPFFEEDDLVELACECIEREDSRENREYLLNSAVRELQLNEATLKDWKKINEVASKYSIRNETLILSLKYHEENSPKVMEEILYQGYKRNNEDQESIDDIFEGLDITTNLGINSAIQRYIQKTNGSPITYDFWSELINRVDERNVLRFLQELILSENIDFYDLKTALSQIPSAWFDKVSVKRSWPKLLEEIGHRFSTELTSTYTLKSFATNITALHDSLPFIKKGILEGLSEKSDLANASTFFGFVEIASTLLTPQQAIEALDFGLARFELHINEEYSDGSWSQWLEPPENMDISFAGFVWSALGSPKSKIRWQAAHCVRRLAQSRNSDILDALIKWMEKDSVDAFGSSKFPFYNLHARLYLLIALARISMDYPESLIDYRDLFVKYSLKNSPHILIQIYSSKIALNIEKAIPHTYTEAIIKQLNQVGKSLLPTKDINYYKEKVDSYWHKNGMVDPTANFHHGYDFNSYWLEPLGRVFGVSEEQVEELATQIIVNEFGIKEEVNYRTDPRSEIWRSARNEKETWYDHGSYPRTDNYSFYLSYHAMLVVAAQLLQKMPIIKGREWCEDEWSYWLNRHLLTRDDGHWLSDRRDPAPLKKPEWTNENIIDDWESDISIADFLEGIIIEQNGQKWINVFGFWEENDSSRKEVYNISSSLVCPVASQSLLNALSTCSNPHDFKLPEYQEEDMEFYTSPFILKGWIEQENTELGLDRFDPHASNIPFPPYFIGNSIVDTLDLKVDNEKRQYFVLKEEYPSVVNELWSTNQTKFEEGPIRMGNRLLASLPFLKKLCLTMNCELIIEVQIRRNFNRNFYQRSTDKSGYKPPLNKIFILTTDGKLRDSRTYYKLG